MVRPAGLGRAPRQAGSPDMGVTVNECGVRAIEHVSAGEYCVALGGWTLPGVLDVDINLGEGEFRFGIDACQLATGATTTQGPAPMTPWDGSTFFFAQQHTSNSLDFALLLSTLQSAV